MVPAAQRMRRRVRPLVRQAAATPGADRYRKHFSASAHLQILLEHVLSGSPSLRQTHARLASQGWSRVGAAPVSRSQLSRSSTSRDPACAEALFAALGRCLRTGVGDDPQARRLAKVQVLDSTFLPLSLALSPWSAHRRHPAGVRLQVGYDLAAAVPTDLHLTLADTHDTREWLRRDLTAVAGWTLLFDLGYYGHPHLARLMAQGVSFVCPLHPQAKTVPTAHRPVPADPLPSGDRLVADETIVLGSPNHRGSTVVREVRLLTSRTPRGEERRFLTDRFDLAAAEVLALYRLRWQIELFFRWLKHRLGATTPLGASRAAVWLTVLICACVALLAALAEPDRPRDVTRVAWLRTLAPAVHLGPNSS